MALRLSLLILALLLSACGEGEPKVFDADTAAQKWDMPGKIWTEAELRILDRGAKLYRVNCSVCHSQDGNGDNQMGVPALDRSPSVIGKKPDFLALILQGKKGSSMPAFAESLSDNEVASIATYIRNAWQNRSGDVVRVDDVVNAR